MCVWFVCVCVKEGQGGFGIQSVSIGILAWQTGTHTLSYTLSLTLSHSGSPPLLFVHRLSVTRGSRDRSS